MADKEKNRSWRERNREYLKEDKNRKIVCDCGVTYTNKNRARHFRSKNHNPFWYRKPNREKKFVAFIKSEIPKNLPFEISF